MTGERKKEGEGGGYGEEKSREKESGGRKKETELTIRLKVPGERNMYNIVGATRRVMVPLMEFRKFFKELKST